jgi:hypothetical protein
LPNPNSEGADTIHAMANGDGNITLAGAFHFPVPIGVTPECLSASFDVVIAGTSGRLTLPACAWCGDTPGLVRPALPEALSKAIHRWVETDNASVPHTPWGFVISWNTRARELTGAGIAAAFIEFQVPVVDIRYLDYLHGLGEPRGDLIDGLFRDVDGWFDGLRTWIEVAVDQDVDPNHPISAGSQVGAGLILVTDDDGTLSLPVSAHEIHVTMSTEELVDLTQFRKAVELANARSQPSDAHILLRDGRAAARRGSRRRAVIDAGGAVEMTLAAHNRTAVGVMPRPGAMPTLGWYIRQPEVIRATGLAEQALLDDLVTPRNEAIHQNRVPSHADTQTALATAQRVVTALDPLPI